MPPTLPLTQAGTAEPGWTTRAGCSWLKERLILGACFLAQGPLLLPRGA